MKEYLVLTPFCLKSVIIYHQIKKNCADSNLELLGWFESNPNIWSEKYDEAYIIQPYYSPHIKIVVCSEVENIKESITNKYKSWGYDDEDILEINDINHLITISDYVAASNIDIKKFSELRPEKNLFPDFGDGICQIKRMRKWCEYQDLIDEADDLTYEQFDNNFGYPAIRESFVDKFGKTHIILKRFEVDLTNRCTLKCKYCTAMMQYYKNPVDVDSDTVINDYNRMLDIIDWADDVLLMGGEPLLYKELYKVLQGILKNPNTSQKIGMVKIVTNGTIIPDGDLLNLMSSTNIMVVVSNYGENSRNIIELTQKLIEYKVKYYIYPIVMEWRKIKCLCERNRPKNDDELLEMRKECLSRNRTVSNGKFYMCSFIKSVHMLKAVPQYEDHYIDLYDENAKEKIAKYISYDMPLPKACSWCSGDSMREWGDSSYIVYGSVDQLKKPLEYQTYPWAE